MQRIAVLEAGNLAVSQGEKIPTILFRPAYSGGLCHLDPEAWPLPVVFDIAGIERVDVVPVVRDHDQNKKVGQTTSIEYTDTALNADAQAIYLGIDENADAVIKLWKRGARLQASIHTGLIPEGDCEQIPAGQVVHVNGQDIPGPCEVVRKCSLREISIVTVGADAKTQVFIEAALAAATIKRKGTEMAVNLKQFFSNLIKQGGTDKRTVARLARAAHAAAAEDGAETKPEEPQAEDGETKPEDGTCSDGDTPDEEATAEEEEQKEFEAFLEKIGVDPAKLSEDETQVLQAAYASLAAARAADEVLKPEDGACEESNASPENKNAPASFSGGSRGRKYGSRMASASQIVKRKQTGYRTFTGSGNGSGVNQCRVAEAALLLTTGRTGPELESLKFSKNEIDSAMTASNQGLTIKGLAYRAGLLSLNNCNDTSRLFNGLQSAIQLNGLRGARAGEYRAASAAGNLSNIDIPNILANVMYKSLLAGLQQIEDPTDKLSKVVTAQDFRPQNFYMLDLSGELAPVKDNGELENLKISDRNFTNAVDLRGFELNVPYKAIVDDNTNALADLPSHMGRKAAIRKQKYWWNTLIGALSSVGTVTGNPALSLTGLDTMMSQFLTIKDNDGDPLGIRGKYLIVPPGLKGTAESLQRSTTVLAAGDTDRIIPDNNYLANSFESICSEFIGSNGVCSGWANNGYMLLCDPAILPVVIMGYLHGKNTPQMETVYGDYKIQGLKIGCWWGFGTSIADTRAAIYSTGAGS